MTDLLDRCRAGQRMSCGCPLHGLKAVTFVVEVCACQCVSCEAICEEVRAEERLESL